MNRLQVCAAIFLVLGLSREVWADPTAYSPPTPITDNTVLFVKPGNLTEVGLKGAPSVKFKDEPPQGFKRMSDQANIDYKMSMDGYQNTQTIDRANNNTSIENNNDTVHSTDNSLKDANSAQAAADNAKSAAQTANASAAKAQKAAEAAEKALEEFKGLTQTDTPPQFHPPGTPDVPSQCVEGGCGACYDSAVATLDKARRGLEQLRNVSEYTHKTAQQGESLMQGVGASAGAHAAIAAYDETNKVEASLKNFDEKVASKKTELLGKLDKGLQDIGACETQYYHSKDWYTRFGLVYYQFMAARY